VADDIALAYVFSTVAHQFTEKKNPAKIRDPRFRKYEISLETGAEEPIRCGVAQPRRALGQCLQRDSEVLLMAVGWLCREGYCNAVMKEGKVIVSLRLEVDTKQNQ